MADADIARQFINFRRFENFREKSQSAVGSDSPLGAGSIADGNSARLLPSVLERFQSVVDRTADITAVEVIHTEYAAFFL